MFLFFFATSSVVGDSVSPVIKILICASTLLVIALSIRTKTEFQLAILGLSTAGAIMSMRGLLYTDDFRRGVDPIELAGPNSLSLFVLPPLLLAGHVVMDETAPKQLKTWLLSCVLLMVIAVFSSTNRSGWAGTIIVAAMLLASGKSIRVGLVFVGLGAACYFVMDSLGSIVVIEEGIGTTLRGGPTSDELRWRLFKTSIAIGLENPVLGVSPDGLSQRLGSRIGRHHHELESHNVIGQIVGAHGLLTAVALLVFFASLWASQRRADGRTFQVTPVYSKRQHFALTWRKEFDRCKAAAGDDSPAALAGDDGNRRPIAENPPRSRPSPFRSGDATRSAQLLRMMTCLWLVRGLFSHDIIYSPSFSMGLGIAIGACIATGGWSKATTPVVYSKRLTKRVAAATS